MKFFPLIIWLVLVMAGSVTTSNAQNKQLSSQSRIDIPFELKNNLIIVDLVFNKRLPLKFIWDTGAEHTILTKRELAEFTGLKFSRKFKVLGADMTTELVAFLSRQVHFRIGDLVVPSQDILALEEDYFYFEEMMGIEVHGIIGASIFGRYTMKIDYTRKMISLFDPSRFKISNKYQEIPLEIYKNKPYLTLNAQISPHSAPTSIKLLLDTGASMTLLLYSDTAPELNPPEQRIPSNIGRGLGGFLEGFIGRTHHIRLGNYQIHESITNFQDIDSNMDTTYINNRNGIIGNTLLKRFDVVIDYPTAKLYLKPNRWYKKKFKFDRSGILFIASGTGLSTFDVSYVVPNSPADEAGILPGDRIKRLNWMPSSLLSLEGINRILRGRVGKRIKLKIIRNGETLKKRFRLRDLI